MDYDLELDKCVNKIKKQKAKKVLIQLPDGLKPKASEIAKYLEEKTKANIFIWLNSCYGACDIPNIKNMDLIIQFGHSDFMFKSKLTKKGFKIK